MGAARLAEPLWAAYRQQGYLGEVVVASELARALGLFDSVLVDPEGAECGG
jgi:hypothetical protein